MLLARRYKSWAESGLPRSPRRAWGVFGLVRGLIVSALIAVPVVGYLIDPNSLAFQLLSVLGAPAIIFLFIANLAYIGSFATAWLDQFRIPAITGVLLLALGFSLFDITDNHEVTIVGSRAGEAKAANIAFEEWYWARKDRDHFKDKPYPIFIAAAAGGGLYAAQHTAMFLSRMQDRCPGFGQHLFAISGVSGGSLGATVFAGLANASATNTSSVPCLLTPTLAASGTGSMETDARAVLGQDFLSPLAAAALFPDFLQRLIPYPVNGLSRAHALENSFEQAWTRAKLKGDPANPFLLGVRDHWRADGAAPALFLNATVVDDGRRFIMASMKLQADNSDPALRISPLPERWSGAQEFIRNVEFSYNPNTQETDDIALKTAVRLSASFPILTPAAMLWLYPAPPPVPPESPVPPAKRFKIRLVDGGYFENSGVETAHDLYYVLKAYEQKPAAGSNRPWVKINLITIGGYTALANADYSRFDNSFGEALSPVRSLLATRDRRGYLAWYRFMLASCGSLEPTKICTQVASSLDLTNFHIPLGWVLSPLTTKLISSQIGRPEHTVDWLDVKLDQNSTDPDLKQRAQETIFGWVQENDEGACNIVLMLSGRTEGDLRLVRQKEWRRRIEVQDKDKKPSEIAKPSREELCALP